MKKVAILWLVGLIITVLHLVDVWAGASWLSFFIVIVLALYFLVKYRTWIKGQDLVWGLILGALAALSPFLQGNWSFAAWDVFLPSLLTYTGSRACFRAWSVDFRLIRYGPLRTLVTIGGLGGFMALYNNLAFILLYQTPIQPGHYGTNFLLALTYGIWEEIAFRMIYLALAMEILKGQEESSWEKLGAYYLMTVPHALIHFGPDQSILTVFITASLMVLFFGLPFAFMQRRLT